MRRTFPMTAALLAVAAACAQSPESPREAAPGAPVATPSQSPEPVPPREMPAGVTGEVPDELLARMRADLEKRIGAAAAEARVVQAEALVWPDGALGCPEPGQMYTQATVPGYRVQFAVGDRIYSYHAAERGLFKLCNAPAGSGPKPPARPVR